MNNETMDNLRTAIRRFLDYQLDSDTNADDSDAYTQLVAAYAIEWSCERLKIFIIQVVVNNHIRLQIIYCKIKGCFWAKSLMIPVY